MERDKELAKLVNVLRRTSRSGAAIGMDGQQRRRS
jgi:hypothetical protein